MARCRKSVERITGDREGYILAFGRKFYLVFKYDWPMEFWYGLVETANREDSPTDLMLDVRHLPAKYLAGRQLECRLPEPTGDRRKDGPAAYRAMQGQRMEHCFALALAVHDGFDFEAHARSQNEAAIEEARQYRERMSVMADCDDEEAF